MPDAYPSDKVASRSVLFSLCTENQMPVPSFKKKSDPGIGGSAVPAFSKKKGGVSTVSGGGQRSGFTPHIKSTNAGRAHSAPGMVGGPRINSGVKTTGPLGGVRAAKGGNSGKAAKTVAPFSKKKV
jgi:hypothetical protein